MKGNGSVLGFFQKLGKAMMTPIAALPAAALLMRLGAADVLDIPWMASAGSALFDNLALLFAVGIAIGLAEENNGVAGLAGMIGYFVLTNVMTSMAPVLGAEKLDMGVLAGFLTGIIGGLLYNKFKDVKLPQILGFFGGRRFVPIVTSFVCLVLGLGLSYVWVYAQDGLNTFGNTMAASGIVGAFGFGLFNRLLIPIGLHHVLNSVFWFQFGEYTNAAGEVINGDIYRFLAGDTTAGAFQTGFFPIMMFALPAACLAMICAAKKENRKAVSGMLISIAATAFLTGVTEPIEFTFMFLAPMLYLVHAVLTGVSLAVTTMLGMRHGFAFSAGATDYILNFNLAENPIGLALVGLCFAVIYFVIFYFAIKKFNLPTPGREEENLEDEKENKELENSDLDEVANKVIEALGGKDNIVSTDACITRLRMELKDSSIVDEKALKDIGAKGVMKMGTSSCQVIIGTLADPLASRMKKILK